MLTVFTLLYIIINILPPILFIQNMRFELTFNLNNLKPLKGLFEILQKVIFSQKVSVPMSLIYYMEKSTIRFLIDLEESPVIIAVDEIVLKNKIVESSTEKELIIIPIVDSKFFIEKMITILNNDKSDITMFLRKERLGKNEIFRFLKIAHQNEVYRCEINAVEYDKQEIRNHFWVNGVLLTEQKAMFIFSTQMMLNFLRMFVKFKDIQQREKWIYLSFNLSTQEYNLSLDNSKHRAKGTIFEVQAHHEKEFMYEIRSQSARTIYEAIVKYPDMKAVIDGKNRLSLVYEKQHSYLSHLLTSEWIKPTGAGMNYGNQQMKIEPQQMIMF